MGGEKARHAAKLLRRTVGKIRAAVAVQVDVHKAGQQHRPRRTIPRAHRRNAAPFRFHIARVKPEIRPVIKNAFKQHDRLLLCAIPAPAVQPSLQPSAMTASAST